MSAHWLIPPRPAPMGSRPAPGVPSVGHTLDPQRCPACLGGVLPALPTLAPKAKPAPVAQVKPPAAVPKPVEKPSAPADCVWSTTPTHAPYYARPSAEMRAGVRDLVERRGRIATAEVLGVDVKTVDNVVEGFPTTAPTRQRVAAALREVSNGRVFAATVPLVGAEIAALSLRVARHGIAVVARAAGISQPTIRRLVTGKSTAVRLADKVRQYLRSNAEAVPGAWRARILVAAADVALSRGSFYTPFDEAALIVRAWEMYPESFALRGFPQHPDSNRVRAKLSGEDGLVSMGWLCRCDAGVLVLTARGVDALSTYANAGVAA